MIENDIFTVAVHAGRDPHAQGSIAPPIYMSSVFAFPDAEQGALIHEGLMPGYFYGRMGTPTQTALERAMCELEGGEDALAVASGMSAIATTLLSLLAAGDEIVAPAALYASTALLLDELTRFGVTVTSVDMRDPAAIEAAVTPRTRALYLETPSNPTLQLTDNAAAVSIARQRGIVTVVDNTFATPVNQTPLADGIDVVVHSATKYLGGHGDLLAGVIVGKKDLIHRARWHTLKIFGGVISPWNAWLVLRGLKTLPIRMARHNENALCLAQFLATHPGVVSVHYPGLKSHAQHDLAARQMRGFGGILSFDVGDRETGRRLVNALRLCTLAVSLGDTSTLVQHSASMTHASASQQRRVAAGISEGLIRVSVGLERVQDIVADFEQALRVAMDESRPLQEVRHVEHGIE